VWAVEERLVMVRILSRKFFGLVFSDLLRDAFFFFV